MLIIALRIWKGFGMDFPSVSGVQTFKAQTMENGDFNTHAQLHYSLYLVFLVPYLSMKNPIFYDHRR